ncbi:beta strand repeat-containing protein [Thiothrix subterranea]|uniref:beta strand repeat-containing protein n=1 Tax=Thiothrix subterranea TaxID=2735563 RepID=UPI00280BDDBB|nr:Calx-beta domain-containing protein [Thiothrix subterranea]
MARILLSQNEGLNIASDNAEVIGAAGVEKVIIFDNAPFNVDAVKLDQNVERAELAQANSTYKYQAAGNVLKVFGADGKLVMEMPVNTSGAQTIAVGDGSMVVKFETSGANAGKVTVGGTPVVATVGGAALVGATLNAADASSHGPVVSTSSTFSIAAATASAAEGNSGTTNLSVTVSRTGDITKVASVTVATADGTATIGDSDYVAVTQVVSFAAGESTKTVSLAVNGDTKVESNETFSVALSAASAGDSINAAAQSVSLTITNDDVAAVNQTFVLTVNPDGFTGGDGDDQFIASDATLSAADVLNGAAGNDTLRYASSFAGAVIENGFATSNIENIRVTSDAAGGTSFDMTGVNGATVMANDNSSTNLALTGVKTILDLEMLNVTGGNTTVAYQAGVVAGTADTQKILLNNVKDNAGLPVSSVTINGIETFAVTTAGTSSSVTSLAGDRLTKVTLAGDKDLSVQNVLTGIATVDATAFTGKLTATVDATQSLNVTGGTADDVISVSGNLGANDTLNGGAGTDTLSVSNAQATTGTNGATVSNFEQLGVTNAASGIINMDNFTGFSKVILDAGMGAPVSVTNAVTGLVIEVDVDVATTVATPAPNDLTSNTTNLTLALKTNGTADTATILFDDINNNDVIPAGSTIPGANQVGIITANEVETLNLEGSKLAGGASQTLNIAGLNATQMKTLNINSDAALTLANGNPGQTTTAALTKVDASASTGNLNLNSLSLATTGATVIGGTGDDRINAGAGTGADTLTGGAGKDVFVFEVGDSTTTATDTITDFVSGTDSLNLSNYGLLAANQFVGTFNDFGSAQGALLNTGGSAVFEANFDGQGNGRLWIDNGAAFGTLDAADNRIILKGVSSVTAADLGLAAGNTINLTAPAALTNTTTNNANATAQTSAGPDTINSTVANLVGSSINGGTGTDKLVISDAVTTANFALDDGAPGTGSIQSVEEVTLLSGTSCAGTFNMNGEFARLNASAASIVTLNAAGLRVEGSTGADTVNTTTAFLNNATINGATGSDTLAISAVTALTSLNNGTTGGSISNIEAVTLANGTGGFGISIFDGVGVSITTGAASIVALGNGGQTFTGMTGNQVVVDNATSNDTITTGAGADVITSNGGNDNIQTGAAADVVNMTGLTSADTVNGGGNAGDTLNITDAASAAGTDLTNVSGFDTLNINGSGTYVTTDGLVAAAATLTVSAAAATAAVTFNGAAETNGFFSITGSTFADTLTGGAAADFFDGGAGNDTITGGAGSDGVQSSAGNDVVNLGEGADIFVATPGAVAGNATVTGGAGSDLYVLVGADGDQNSIQSNGIITITDFALGAAGDQIYLDLTGTDIFSRANFGAMAFGDDLVILGEAQTTAQITAATNAVVTNAAVLAVFNSSTGKGELWFDANWADNAGRTQIATLDNMTSAAQLGGLSAISGVDFFVV